MYLSFFPPLRTVHSFTLFEEQTASLTQGLLFFGLWRTKALTPADLRIPVLLATGVQFNPPVSLPGAQDEHYRLLLIYSKLCLSFKFDLFCLFVFNHKTLPSGHIFI